MKKTLAALLGLAFCALLINPASAEYPDKVVRIIVPVAAGGGVDVMARLLAQRLSERLGQQFIVENRAGAAGVIGTKSVIRTPADGYTLLYTPSSLSLTVAVSKTAPYDVDKDLTPIVNVAVSPYALAVSSALPAKTVGEFIAYAKANPGKLSYSSAGIGSASHLAAELFKSMAGIEMVHVPNKGMSPALVDLMGAQVQAMFASVPALLDRAIGPCAADRHGGEEALGADAEPADHQRIRPARLRGRQLGRSARPRGARSGHREEAACRDHRHPRHAGHEGPHQEARLRRAGEPARRVRDADPQRRGALVRGGEEGGYPAQLSRLL